MAAGDGMITQMGWSGGYGNLVEVRHPNSVTTRYGHLRVSSEACESGSG
jgi:murein DD-endopeptidase MepM/ murein hydrolase activator NlpD